MVTFSFYAGERKDHALLRREPVRPVYLRRGGDTNTFSRQLIRRGGWVLGASFWLAASGIVMAATIDPRKTANPPAIQSPPTQPVQPGPTAPGANVAPVPLPLKDLRVQPYVAGGNNAVGTVELVQAVPSTQGAGGLNVAVPSPSVALQTSRPDLVQVPPQIAVIYGNAANFAMTTRPVGNHTLVTITARMGAQTKQATLQIRAPWVENLTVNVPEVCGSDKSEVTVRLSGPAAPGGTHVRVHYLTPGSQGWNAAESLKVSAGQRSESMRLLLPTVSCSAGFCGIARAAARTANHEFSLDPSTNAPWVMGGEKCTKPQ
jgi:hypothetical protein